MSKVDVAVVEEPLPSAPWPGSSVGKQLQVADPEGTILEDDENPEFKLPKMSSLAIVLTTNLLMQVISHLHLTDGSRFDSLRNTRSLFSSSFHHRACTRNGWEAARRSLVSSSVSRRSSQP
jgi:hypothetical protein